MRLVASFLAVVLATSCISLVDYPEYWEMDDSFVTNSITLPFEVLVTPLIFLIKLLPFL
ncbi:MAG: hypothetical protein O7B99_03215 [Planctomycetota bacterium]|nr:hypothetical protein [Planctomycetota bacterium]